MTTKTGVEDGKQGETSNPSNRRIFVNIEADKSHRYSPNEIRTSKYTPLTFLPKNLFEQFHGLANFYFLGVVILQIFPEFSNVSIAIPTLPVVFILLATAIKVF
jgi:phospholipid-translocating ATPase